MDNTQKTTRALTAYADPERKETDDEASEKASRFVASDRQLLELLPQLPRQPDILRVSTSLGFRAASPDEGAFIDIARDGGISRDLAITIFNSLNSEMLSGGRQGKKQTKRGKSDKDLCNAILRDAQIKRLFVKVAASGKGATKEEVADFATMCLKQKIMPASIEYLLRACGIETGKRSVYHQKERLRAAGTLPDSREDDESKPNAPDSKRRRRANPEDTGPSVDDLRETPLDVPGSVPRFSLESNIGFFGTGTDGSLTSGNADFGEPYPWGDPDLAFGPNGLPFMEFGPTYADTQFPPWPPIAPGDAAGDVHGSPRGSEPVPTSPPTARSEADEAQRALDDMGFWLL